MNLSELSNIGAASPIPFKIVVLNGAKKENNKPQTELTVTREHRILIGAAVVAERDAVVVSVSDLESYVRLFLD